VIDKGKLIELGTHPELMEMAGTYANLVRVQVGSSSEDNGDASKEEEVS
jgi:ABC-type transport system involved in cytochrome bd biosynthesis fused ATPase/permease subunit